MTCIECESFNLRADPKMAAHGYAQCDKQKWVSVGPKNPDCDRAVRVDATVIQARIEWLERRKL